MRPIFILIALCLFTLCNTQLSASNVTMCRVSKGGINFQVDQRMELLAIIQYLSGSNMVSKDPPEYTAAIDNWFGKLRNHPIFSLWQKLEKRGFAYDAPVVYFLQFESIPFINKQNNFPEYYHYQMSDRMHKILPDKAAENELLEQLNDFVTKSRFDDFVVSQTDFYLSQVNTTASVMPDEDVAQAIISWYGYSQDSYNFLVSPLLGGNGYGPCVKNRNGGLDLYCIASALTDKRSLLGMILHEFSHSYINPLVDENYKSLKRAKNLYKPIKQIMKQQAYGSWWVTLIEHYVRASAIHLQISISSEESLKSMIKGELGRGFIYIPYIDEDFQHYEQLRMTEGTNFRDFFPHMVKRMNDLAKNPRAYIEQASNFHGNINSVFAPDMLIIVPSDKADSTIAKFIMPNAEFVAGRIGGKIITDVQALNMKLGKNPLVVYGCPQQNKWLAKYMNRVRFQIYADRIVADKEYLGKDLRIIAAESNPYNSKLGMIIYTAQRPENMKSCNAVFHGPQEFVVSEASGNVIGEGFYE